MKGTVGSGKSTVSQMMKDKLETLGFKVIIEGMDKYSKQNIKYKQAENTIKSNITNALKTQKNTVVIIDTCGENNNGNIIFGYDFSGWKQVEVMPNFNKENTSGYLSWSLRNVLNRSISTNETNYWLNPISAGKDVCISVHSKKAQALQISTSGFNANNIDRLADEYQVYLNEHMTLDEQINTAINNIN